MQESRYDQAEICLNGHVTNHSVLSSPIHSMKFCDECGARTIRICESCSHPIRGRLHVSGYFGNDKFLSPMYCNNCGAKMPWAESGLVAVNQILMQLEDLDEADVSEIMESLELLLSDGPKSVAAAGRVKKVLGKMGIAGNSMLKEVATSLVTETSRRIIWGS